MALNVHKIAMCDQKRFEQGHKKVTGGHKR